MPQADWRFPGRRWLPPEKIARREKLLRQAKRRKRGPLGIGWGWWTFGLAFVLPFLVGLAVVLGASWIVPVGAIALLLLYAIVAFTE